MADLFDVVVARKLSGGGGSSDLSTATVTLVNNTGGSAFFNMPIVRTTEQGVFVVADVPDGDPHTTEEVVVPIAKDGCIATQDEVSGNVSLSGNASFDQQDNSRIIITGDCTITVS